jgi:hypothetical protein
MHLKTFASVILAISALAGCGETPATSTPTSFAPTNADRASPAYQACVAAIAETTGKDAVDIAVFDYLYSEANTQVQATVAGAEAPWRCLSSNSGVVAEVIYTGSEGAL